MYPIGKDRVGIQIFRIKNRGSNDYDIKIERKLPPMTMGRPKNQFERKLLEAYDRCRTKALRRYFPTLEARAIHKLMRDNYLQPKDLENLISHH
jgi:hypothetical protein